MATNNETKITLEVTVGQAEAINAALDVYSRLCLGQLTEVASLVSHGVIPMYGGHDAERKMASGDVVEDIDSMMRAAKALLGYSGNGNLGVSHPHVSLEGHRTYEVLKVLQKVVAETRQPNPSFRGVHYDGLGLRYTQDPAPMAFATPEQEVSPREDIAEVVARLPRLPQRQDATNDQLRDLRIIAKKMGMYDADDLLRSLLERCART